MLSDEQVSAFRARAVEVAMELFVEDGYEGFSLRSLARAMGCSHTTPYRYFEGKEAIFAAVRAEGFRRFAAALRARLGGSRDPAKRLRKLAEGYYAFAVAEPAAFRVIFEMGQPEAEAYPFVREAMSDAWGVLVGTVAEGIEAGVIAGEPEVVAHTMWSGIHGVATLQLAGKLLMGRSGNRVLGAMVDAMLAAHRPLTSSKEET